MLSPYRRSDAPLTALSSLITPVCGREEQGAKSFTKILRILPIQSILMTSVRMSSVLTMN